MPAPTLSTPTAVGHAANSENDAATSSAPAANGHVANSNNAAATLSTLVLAKVECAADSDHDMSNKHHAAKTGSLIKFETKDIHIQACSRM
jgi:hypothetical protein